LQLNVDIQPKTASGNNHMKTLRILGTRGIPAAHGGFETFAEHLALYLRSCGWRVIVYCQESGQGEIFEDTWQGIERVRIPVKGNGSWSSIVFDWISIKHAAKHQDLCLTLGYNTAIFDILLRVKGIPNVINMDGIEWIRAKWGKGAKAWFWLNDWIGCLTGNHLVADHPAIKTHLMTRVSGDKITMIPYGAVPVESAPQEPVRALNLEPGRYLTVIARPEPENSLLEIVKAFSQKRRGYKLAVLGCYEPGNAYHNTVRAAASDEVVFLGAIYDAPTVQALRFHSAAYVHGHQVGGTNPSLVEALGAGNAVIAHDNRFNRWVAGKGAFYFDSVDSLASQFEQLLSDTQTLDKMRGASRQRFQQALTWPIVLSQYEDLLTRFLPSKETFFRRFHETGIGLASQQSKTTAKAK
jgi:glycosyltransferase involved in cell wall biosynthesis